jgi:quinol monooxygenase YgiN
MVTIEYRVEPEQASEFVAAMQRVGRMRRRTGAYEWQLFRDPTQPDRFVETFLTRTWAEHLRQHTRPTMTDQRIQDAAQALTKPGTEPVISHFIATHPAHGPRPR